MSPGATRDLLAPRFDGVPAALKALDQWVVWKLVSEDEGSFKKIPCMPSGRFASSTDATTWSSYADVVAAYGRGGFAGVGFVVTAATGIVGVDLDKLEDHGHQPEVKAIYKALLKSKTYVELSPSGTGLRAFLRGKLPFAGKNNRQLGMELYSSGRYLTVTGHRLEKAGQDIVAGQATIDKIGALAFPAPAPVQSGAPNIPATATSASANISDGELINLACTAKNGEAFSLLWAGKFQEYYLLQNKPPASQSEADLALCHSLAFWTGKNAVRIDRLFRASGLMRPKWDETRGAMAYGQQTVAKAIDGCSQVYTPRGVPASALRLVDLSTVTAVPLEWLWDNFLPLGKVSLIAGNPGLGKSLITLDIAARVSLGGVWPTGEPATQGRVILICGEDDVADTVVPRLNAAGADLTRIEQIASVIERDEKGKPRDRGLSLQRDLEHIEAELMRNPDTRLVVIDPISAYLGNVDSHNNAETRALLEPLTRMAQQYQVAIILVSHLNKGSGQAIYRTTGSIAFVAAARAAFIVAKDDSDQNRRYFLPTKTNLSKDSTGIGYEVKVATNNAPYVFWDRQTVTGEDLDSLLDVTPADERPRLQEAIVWLTDQLAFGHVPSTQIAKNAKKDGIAPRTLDRAKAKLKVGAKKMGAAWSWVMPAPAVGTHAASDKPAPAVATHASTVMPPFPQLGPPPAWVTTFPYSNL